MGILSSHKFYYHTLAFSVSVSFSFPHCCWDPHLSYIWNFSDENGVSKNFKTSISIPFPDLEEQHLYFFFVYKIVLFPKPIGVLCNQTHAHDEIKILN